MAAEPNRGQPDGIWVESGYGANTDRPFVSLRLRDVAVMISPDEARDVAHNLLACAEAAESDAFIIRFAREDLDLEPALALQLLRRYRDLRSLLAAEEAARNRDARP